MIRYSYDGDEAAWQRAVDAFLAAIAADAEVQGRFCYVVTIATDGATDGVTRMRVYGETG